MLPPQLTPLSLLLETSTTPLHMEFAWDWSPTMTSADSPRERKLSRELFNNMVWSSPTEEPLPSLVLATPTLLTSGPTLALILSLWRVSQSLPSKSLLGKEIKCASLETASATKVISWWIPQLDYWETQLCSSLRLTVGLSDLRY